MCTAGNKCHPEALITMKLTKNGHIKYQMFCTNYVLMRNQTFAVSQQRK